MLSPLYSAGVIIDVGFIRRVVASTPPLWGLALEDLVGLFLHDNWWGLLNHLSRYTLNEDGTKDSIKALVEINEWLFSLRPIIEELRSEVKPFYETQLSCSFEGRDFSDVRVLDSNSVFIKLR